MAKKPKSLSLRKGLDMTALLAGCDWITDEGGDLIQQERGVAWRAGFRPLVMEEFIVAYPNDNAEACRKKGVPDSEYPYTVIYMSGSHRVINLLYDDPFITHEKVNEWRRKQFELAYFRWNAPGISEAMTKRFEYRRALVPSHKTQASRPDVSIYEGGYYREVFCFERELLIGLMRFAGIELTATNLVRYLGTPLHWFAVNESRSLSGHCRLLLRSSNYNLIPVISVTQPKR